MDGAWQRAGNQQNNSWKEQAFQFACVQEMLLVESLLGFSSKLALAKTCVLENLGTKSLVRALLQASSAAFRAAGGASLKKCEPSCVLARSFLLLVPYLLTRLSRLLLNQVRAALKDTLLTRTLMTEPNL